MENINPSQVGLITEMQCQVFLIEHGYNVLTPIGNHQKYDLVIEKDGKFTKIQVKHAKSQNEGKSFLVKTRYDVRDITKSQRVRHEKYTVEDCDYFMTTYQDKFYLFPVFGTSEARFWLQKSRLSTQKYAEDYLAEKVLQNL